MQVVVLAGGIGSRLRPWTNLVPKPLLPMLDRTLLEQVIYTVPSDLIDEVVVAGGYKVDMIKSYFDSIECDFDVRIVNETEPLGTGGALGNCRDVVSDTFACFKGCMSHKDVKYKLLYDSAQERIENEFDIIKLVKHMRELKVIAKNADLTEKHKFLIDHQSLNIIDLGTDAEKTDSTCNENEDDVEELQDFID